VLAFLVFCGIIEYKGGAMSVLDELMDNLLAGRSNANVELTPTPAVGDIRKVMGGEAPIERYSRRAIIPKLDDIAKIANKKAQISALDHAAKSRAAARAAADEILAARKAATQLATRPSTLGEIVSGTSSTAYSPTARKAAFRALKTGDSMIPLRPAVKPMTKAMVTLEEAAQGASNVAKTLDAVAPEAKVATEALANSGKLGKAAKGLFKFAKGKYKPLAAAAVVGYLAYDHMFGDHGKKAIRPTVDGGAPDISPMTDAQKEQAAKDRQILGLKSELDRLMHQLPESSRRKVHAIRMENAPETRAANGDMALNRMLELATAQIQRNTADREANNLANQRLQQGIADTFR